MPIHLSIKRSHLQCVQAILEFAEPKGSIKDVGIFQRDLDNNNVLHMAAQGEIEVLSLVIECCGNNFFEMLLEKNNAGLTPIHLAARDTKFSQNLETLIKASNESDVPIMRPKLRATLFAKFDPAQRRPSMEMMTRQIYKTMSRISPQDAGSLTDPSILFDFENAKVCNHTNLFNFSKYYVNQFPYTLRFS